MRRDNKIQKDPLWYSVYMLSIVPLVVLLVLVGVCWNAYVSHSIKIHGVDAVATVIRKYNGTLEYDVLYEGQYYLNSINVNKQVYREVKQGEHFPARILPEKMHLHKNHGITPRYIRIILRPMRIDQQDYEGERRRIDSLYPTYKHHRTGIEDK